MRIIIDIYGAKDLDKNGKKIIHVDSDYNFSRGDNTLVKDCGVMIYNYLKRVLTVAFHEWEKK